MTASPIPAQPACRAWVWKRRYARTGLRVEVNISNVNQEINKHEYNRGQQCHANNGRIIQVEHRVKGILPYPRPVENRLDQHRTAEHIANGQSHDGHYRDHRIAQGVAADHEQWMKPFTMGREYIGFSKLFQHHRTGETHEACQRANSQRDSGQDKMPQCVAEQLSISGQQAIDQQQIGYGGMAHHHTDIRTPSAGQPIEIKEENQDQDNAQPE